jgi:hypothetical protein
MFHLLPLLKGWEYKAHVAYRTNIIRGANPIEVLRIDEIGWLIGITEMTNDAYGTVMIDFQGADLQTFSYSIYPEAPRVLGALAQDPAGWLQKYFRPNPNSTAGLYLAVAFTGGFQGSIYPYVPSVVVKLYLPNESTEASASIQGYAWVVAITDKKAFICSLRRVLDANASLKIDPALLTIGPAQFEKEVKEK